MAPNLARKQTVPEPAATLPNEGASLSALGIGEGEVAVAANEATGKQRAVEEGLKVKDTGRRQRRAADDDCPLVRDLVVGFLSKADPEQACALSLRLGIAEDDVAVGEATGKKRAVKKGTEFKEEGRRQG